MPLLGLSGSLTLRDCPPSHDDWKTLREALFFRLRRKGLYRLHWLTEWQKRGVPHLHFAAWFLQSVVVININQPALSDSELAQVLSYLISADWLSISSVYRSSGLSQVVKPMSNELWLASISVKTCGARCSALPAGTRFYPQWLGRYDRADVGASWRFSDSRTTRPRT